MNKFWDKVEPTGVCLEWTAGKTGSGYGAFTHGGKLHGAHRFAWELLMGPVPKGMVIDHVACGNRACVDPSHMQVVTRGENSRRGQLGRKSPFCRKGLHAMRGENVYRGECRQCKRDRAKVNVVA